ncbi:MAG: hypothetical protein R6U46_01445 [Marinilabilia sp.]
MFNYLENIDPFNSAMFRKSNLILLVCFLVAVFATRGQQFNIPHLRDHGKSTQLMVDGEYWLMLAGELGNSSAASAGYMEDIWTDLDDMELNTLLAPVYRELIEPRRLAECSSPERRPELPGQGSAHPFWGSLHSKNKTLSLSVNSIVR